jgi:hypothetical protein
MISRRALITSLAALAAPSLAELIRMPVDVLVVLATPAIKPAQGAPQTIPIVTNLGRRTTHSSCSHSAGPTHRPRAGSRSSPRNTACRRSPTRTCSRTAAV